MVSYICVVLYNLYSSHMYDFTYSPDGPFLFHVMDEESVSWVHPRSQSWSREHRGGIAEGGWVLSSVLRSVSSLRTLLLSPGSQGRASHGSSWWQNLTLGFHSCYWLRSLYRKKNTFLNSRAILTLFLHTLHPLRRRSCQIIRFSNVQASDINALFRAITRGALA